MPLMKSRSDKAFKHNVEAEMSSGKDQKQSLAIAYAVKRKAKKMAEGGMLTSSGYQSKDAGIHQDQFNEVDPKLSGYRDHMGNDVKHNHMAQMESDRDLNQHGEDEIGPEGNRPGKEDGYAKGGFVKDGHQTSAHEDDMVGRIMKKRQQMYSEGGKVANDDDAFGYEFDTPANYDDLSLRDDLESSYSGENSGDKLGNEYDSDHDDIVSRIMMKRKKQHNPVPA